MTLYSCFCFLFCFVEGMMGSVSERKTERPRGGRPQHLLGGTCVRNTTHTFHKPVCFCHFDDD